jgi:polygalacturonase
LFCAGENFEQAVLMAAGVAAGRLWSARNVLDVESAQRRLEVMRFKLTARGFDAAPLPPSSSASSASSSAASKTIKSDDDDAASSADSSAATWPGSVPQRSSKDCVITSKVYAGGAVPDNRTVNTARIQLAIDQCHAAHPAGARVIVPKGAFRTGSLMLRSNLELHLAAGAGANTHTLSHICK